MSLPSCFHLVPGPGAGERLWCAQELGGMYLKPGLEHQLPGADVPRCCVEVDGGNRGHLSRASVKSLSLDKKKFETAAGYTGFIQVHSTAAF